MVNTPREQGENKSGKSRPTRQNIMKNKSTVPVSYLLEAIQLQRKKKKEEEENVEIDWQKPAVKMMITWKENVNRYAKVLKEKNTVMSILF